MSLIQEQSLKIAASVIKDFGKFGFLYCVRMACAEPNNRLAGTFYTLTSTGGV